MRLIRRFGNEVWLFVVQQKAFKLELIVSLVVFLVFFSAVFWGASKVFEVESRITMVCLFVLWGVFSSAVTTITATIKDDLNFGLIETYNTLPYSYLSVLVLRVFARWPYDLFVGIVAFSVLSLVGGIPIDLQALVMAYLIALFGMHGVIGVAIVLAGLIVRFKKSEISTIIGTALVGMSLALEDIGYFAILAPVSKAADIVRNSVESGNLIFSDLVLLAAFSSVWLFGGVVVFNLLLRGIREKGLLGSMSQ